jgi:cutinase
MSAFQRTRYPGTCEVLMTLRVKLRARASETGNGWSLPPASPSQAVCKHLGMTALSLARIAGVTVVTTWALVSAPIGAPAASADPCSDVAVVFARGTHQEPGLGNIGQAFVDSLTSQAGGRSVGVYAVNYPANDDYHASAPSGADDASAHIQDTVNSCPNTKIVLGGYSQGATVINLASSAVPASVADHVAAVALFGEPSSGFSSMLWGGPLPTINPLYASKTISLCATDDPICSGGGNLVAHVSYIEYGMTNQAATFAVNRLGQRA